MAGVFRKPLVSVTLQLTLIVNSVCLPSHVTFARSKISQSNDQIGSGIVSKTIRSKGQDYLVRIKRSPGSPFPRFLATVNLTRGDEIYRFDDNEDGTLEHLRIIVKRDKEIGTLIFSVPQSGNFLSLETIKQTEDRVVLASYVWSPRQRSYMLARSDTRKSRPSHSLSASPGTASTGGNTVTRSPLDRVETVCENANSFVTKSTELSNYLKEITRRASCSSSDPEGLLLCKRKEIEKDVERNLLGETCKSPFDNFPYKKEEITNALVSIILSREESELMDQKMPGARVFLACLDQPRFRLGAFAEIIETQLAAALEGKNEIDKIQCADKARCDGHPTGLHAACYDLGKISLLSTPPPTEVNSKMRPEYISQKLFHEMIHKAGFEGSEEYPENIEQCCGMDRNNMDSKACKSLEGMTDQDSYAQLVTTKLLSASPKLLETSKLFRGSARGSVADGTIAKYLADLRDKARTLRDQCEKEFARRTSFGNAGPDCSSKQVTKAMSNKLVDWTKDRIDKDCTNWLRNDISVDDRARICSEIGIQINDNLRNLEDSNFAEIALSDPKMTSLQQTGSRSPRDLSIQSYNDRASGDVPISVRTPGQLTSSIPIQVGDPGAYDILRDSSPERSGSYLAQMASRIVFGEPAAAKQGSIEPAGKRTTPVMPQASLSQRPAKPGPRTASSPNLVLPSRNVASIPGVSDPAMAATEPEGPAPKTNGPSEFESNSQADAKSDSNPQADARAARAPVSPRTVSSSPGTIRNDFTGNATPASFDSSSPFGGGSERTPSTVTASGNGPLRGDRAIASSPSVRPKSFTDQSAGPEEKSAARPEENTEPPGAEKSSRTSLLASLPIRNGVVQLNKLYLDEASQNEVLRIFNENDLQQSFLAGIETGVIKLPPRTKLRLVDERQKNGEKAKTTEISAEKKSRNKDKITIFEYRMTKEGKLIFTKTYPGGSTMTKVLP